MPAYSFQERFVPMVLDESKRQTVRKRRLKGYATSGDTLYLYFGLRTKHCRKLREETCVEVNTIVISAAKNIFIFKERLTEYECCKLLKPDQEAFNLLVKKRYKKLSRKEKDRFAWNDGFRPEGASLEDPNGSFELMFRFWTMTHELPFIGDVIFWDSSKKPVNS